MIVTKDLTACKAVPHPFMAQAFAVKGVTPQGAEGFIKDQAGGVVHWHTATDARAAAERFNNQAA